MQIGPRIRVGGTLGKIGEKIKKPLLIGGALALTGGLAGLGPLGGMLGGKLGGLGMIGKLGMAKKVAGAAMGGKDQDLIEGMPGGDMGGGGIGDRFRSIGGFLKDNSRTIADYGKMGEGIYDRYQQNQDRKMAQREYENAAPLRQAAQAGLLDTSRPDVSSIFQDPNATQGRYRRVTVGSRY
jgi:hypothetical protein